MFGILLYSHFLQIKRQIQYSRIDLSLPTAADGELGSFNIFSDFLRAQIWSRSFQGLCRTLDSMWICSSFQKENSDITDSWNSISTLNRFGAFALLNTNF